MGGVMLQRGEIGIFGRPRFLRDPQGGGGGAGAGLGRGGGAPRRGGEGGWVRLGHGDGLPAKVRFSCRLRFMLVPVPGPGSCPCHLPDGERCTRPIPPWSAGGTGGPDGAAYAEG